MRDEANSSESIYVRGGSLQNIEKVCTNSSTLGNMPTTNSIYRNPKLFWLDLNFKLVLSAFAKVRLRML